MTRGKEKTKWWQMNLKRSFAGTVACAIAIWMMTHITFGLYIGETSLTNEFNVFADLKWGDTCVFDWGTEVDDWPQMTTPFYFSIYSYKLRNANITLDWDGSDIFRWGWHTEDEMKGRKASWSLLSG